MVALSKEFYDQLNSIENFTQLPDDDPQVIEIRKRVAFELREDYQKPAYRTVESRQSSLYHETTMDNLTPMRYIYLIQNDVYKSHLVDKLGARKQIFDRWLVENKLTKKYLQKYHVLQNGELVDVVQTLNEVKNYVSYSKDYIKNFIDSGKAMEGGWTVKLVYKFNPTIEELDDFKKNDTFGYWYDKRPSRKGLVRV